MLFLLFGYLSSSSSSFYSSSSFSSAIFILIFTFVSVLPTLRQASFLPTLFAKLFADIPAQYVLGPQHGTCPAQYAPLDLNLAQLSMHHWTSTWDLPNSVCTAGPQPGTCPILCPPLDLNDQIKYQKICQMECQIEYQKICEIKCHEIYQIECQKICQIECHKISDKIPENFPNNISENIPPPGLAPLGWVRFHGMGRTPGAALRVCSRRAPPIPSPTPVQE